MTWTIAHVALMFVMLVCFPVVFMSVFIKGHIEHRRKMRMLKRMYNAKTPQEYDELYAEYCKRFGVPGPRPKEDYGDRTTEIIVKDVE